MTTLGRGLVIHGEITSDEDLTIEGFLNGDIHLPGEASLVIGEHGRVEADLRGGHVTIFGNVKGTVSATRRIELAPSAVVEGNLSANLIVIADGASFHGSIDMGQRTIAAKVAQYKAAQEKTPTATSSA
jgi:cytoskeletal protein CcmA (bactofilin family)